MQLDERMKHYYEQPAKNTLLRRTPVIIRIDGKAFHTFTRGMQKPFDPFVTYTMEQTTKQLCENVQGCVFGYTQSDEISLLLIDYTNLDTDAWFDYDVQKLASVSASMTTLYFNTCFRHLLDADYASDACANARELKVDTALFDARAFNVPREEVTNYFLWRQRDAIRNSVAAVGQSQFSAKFLQGKNTETIKKLLQGKKIDWDKYPLNLQRGSAVIRNKEDVVWIIDDKIPVFAGDDREYIERYLYPDMEIGEK